MIKICDHSIDRYMLNTVGDYVLFQANCFHRGYFYITSNSIYYTAQLFATSSGKQTPRSFWNRQTAIVSTIRCKELTDLSTDIMNYWERKDKYMNDMFNPPKKYDSENIDRKSHRVIEKKNFERLHYLNLFVKQIEKLHENIDIKKVWIMAKSKHEKGFQKWHVDKVDNATTTIVINLCIATT